MQSKEHWDRIYQTKGPAGVSWFQPHACHSLALIRRTGVPPDASIIDMGGGASTLVDDLLDEGFSRLTVLDLSQAALAAAQDRLGERAAGVTWKVGDITQVQLPADAYDVWHDRAVFHFLTSQEERDAYLAAVVRAVRSGGYVVIAAFADDGPTHCSGLPAVRYSADELHRQFGARFKLLREEREEHHAPQGATQRFIYCLFRRQPS